MAIIKWAKALTFICVLSIIFISCTRTHVDRPLLSYQQKAFKAHISWQIGDTAATAIFTSIPTDIGKSLTLEYTAPESLAGISVTKNTEETALFYSDLKIPSEIAASMMAVASFFDIDATLTESTVEEIDGVRFNRITVRAQNGESYSILLYPSTQSPKIISGKLNSLPCTVDIISFEYIT